MFERTLMQKALCSRVMLGQLAQLTVLRAFIHRFCVQQYNMNAVTAELFFDDCSLSELESSRNDLLYELQKQPHQTPTDRDVCIICSCISCIGGVAQWLRCQSLVADFP